MGVVCCLKFEEEHVLGSRPRVSGLERRESVGQLFSGRNQSDWLSRRVK